MRSKRRSKRLDQVDVASIVLYGRRDSEPLTHLNVYLGTHGPNTLAGDSTAS